MRGILPRNMGLYVPGTGYIFPQTNQFVNGALAPTPGITWPGGPAPVQAPRIGVRPIVRKKSGCQCGGRCKKRRGLGTDYGNGTIVIPSPSCPNGGITDEDGNLLGCQGPNGEVQPTETSPTISIPGGIPPASSPGSTSSTGINSVASLFNAVSKDIAAIWQSSKGIPSTTVQSGARSAAAAPSGSFFSQSFAGIPVWGWGLGLVGGIALLSRGGK